MSDIGYLQTKIRELNEKVDEVQGNIEGLSSKFESYSRKFEESDKSIKESLSVINSLLNNIDEKNLSLKINEIVTKSVNRKSEKVIEQIKKDVGLIQKETTDEFSIDIENARNKIGKEITNYVNGTLKHICTILFTVIKDTGDKQKLIGLPMLAFPIKNKYGAEDMMIMFDFNEENVTSSKGVGLIDRFQKKTRLKLVNNNNRKVRKGETVKLNITA